MEKQITIEPDRSVLVVIDMQKGFTEPESVFCVGMAKDTIPTLEKTIERARRAGVHICWVLRKHAKDGSDYEAHRRKKLEAIGQTNLFAEDGWGFPVSEGLIVKEEDWICYKTRYSAFVRTDLLEKLEKVKIKTVLVSGTQTPNCVRATAFDAFQYDFQTILLADCTSSATTEVQQANLLDLKNAGIDVADHFEDLIITKD